MSPCAKLELHLIFRFFFNLVLQNPLITPRAAHCNSSISGSQSAAGTGGWGFLKMSPTQQAGQSMKTQQKWEAPTGSNPYMAAFRDLKLL